MVEKVILHIGTQKTGSTSIQHSLASYDDGKIFMARFPAKNHGFPLHTAFSGNYQDFYQWKRQGLSQKQIKAKRDKFRAQFDEDLRRPDRNVLVASGENIGLIDDEGKEDLIRFIQERNVKVEILCYVRPPIPYAASIFQQYIQGGRDTVPGAIDPQYRRYLDQFSSLVGVENVHVRSFERASLVNGDVIDDFCAFVGIDIANVNKQRVNEALSVSALKLLYAFNRIFPCQSFDNPLWHARAKTIEELRNLYQSDKKVPSNYFEELADLSELQFLKESFGIDFEDSATQETPAAPLNEWLQDFSDVDLSLLAERVSAPESRCEDVEWLISRLFSKIIFDANRLSQELEAVSKERDSLLQDINARKSKLADHIDYIDFKIHDLLSRAPLTTDKFKRRFKRGAELRFRKSYGQVDSD